MLFGAVQDIVIALAAYEDTIGAAGVAGTVAAKIAVWSDCAPTPIRLVALTVK
jgi:hypothetical protein